MSTEQQFFIDDTGPALCATLYFPDGDVSGAILFCNPMFEELKASTRLMVEAARAFCAAGFAVLRFDYRGCGDSEGEFADMSVGDWLDDIGRALRFLNNHCPTADSPVILGVRLGGTLALQALRGNEEVRRVVLWEPVPDCRSYIGQELRKKLTKEMMTFGSNRATRDSLLAELAAGGNVDLDGYCLSARLYSDLCNLDSAGMAGDGREVLLLNVSHQTSVSRSYVKYRDRLEESSFSSTVDAVRLQPFWNLVGYVDGQPLIDRTREWLATAVES
ncbi:MAG: alpha/beta fold hydrolase [Kiritimatiellia bacterium]|jgi:exosortase A-associated hydrolase 2|nr:alpha/beta fold hydrolase [Kiritimatiellia bacterium]